MKSAQGKSSKPQKRTELLINLLGEKDCSNSPHDQKSILITQISEDLIDEPKESTNCKSSIAISIELFHQLIEKELNKAATLLDIDPLELKAWVDLQIEVPAKTFLVLLRTMQSLLLDPLNEEIGFTQFEDGVWQVFISIEGCSKLLNQHPQFSGLTFTQSDTLIEGTPEWIECSIYRRDRIMPITVREYFIEVRSEKDIWKKMPRRMLRHRALQQCVRLAING
jgi:RecT family